MTIEKVKVTKEVAESIEHIRHNCYIGSLGSYLDGEWASPHPKTRLAINELDKDSLLHAIFYGYEIEKTPEDNVLDYYEKVTRFKKRAEDSGNLFRVAELTGEIGGIEVTLNLLGIEIEGVDAY